MIRQLTDEPDYRFTLANERTLSRLAAHSARTAGSNGCPAAIRSRTGGPRDAYTLSMVLGMLAIVSTGAGLLRWRQVDRAIRCSERLPHNRTPALLASGLAVLGLVVSVLAVVKAVNG
jgi:inner membrane protein YidH